MVNLPSLATNDDNNNANILSKKDESLVEVCATKDDQASNINSTADDNSGASKQSKAGANISHDKSIATLKIRNTRCLSHFDSSVPPAIEEKDTFDSNKDEPLLLFKTTPEDIADDGILHLTMKSNVYDFY